MLRKLINFSIILTLVLGLFSFIKFSQAADSPTGLAISPPLTELTINPGDSYSGKIKVTNNYTTAAEVSVTVKDFSAADESGAPTILESTQTSSYSLKDWIQVKEEKVNLEGKEDYEFNYTVQVPTTAEPGGHYGIILFTPTIKSTASSSGSQVSIGMEIGSMVLVNVSGESITAGSLKELFTCKKVKDQDGKETCKNQKLFSYSPIEFVSRIENSGNVHFKPSGEISIKNAFGKEVSTLLFNDSSGNVLPSQIRKFTNDWSYGRRFGWYKANLDLAYGSSGKLQSSLLFFIIPWKETTGGVVILILLIWLLRHVQFKKKE